MIKTMWKVALVSLLALAAQIETGLAANTATAPAKAAPAAKPGKFLIADPVEGYAPVISRTFIAPTPGTMDDPNHKVEVFGQPRVVKGHPCTLWDSDDVARFKVLLKTDKVLAEQLTKLVASMDKRIKEPLNVPGVHKGEDGKWLWTADFPADEPPFVKPGDNKFERPKKVEKNAGANSGDMAKLATAYALSGEEKYGEYCRKMFLAYAENYPRWGRPEGSQWRYAYDGRLGTQFLNDGFYIVQFAWAYDLIHDLPSFTAEDRTKIDQFFRAMATPFLINCGGNRDYLSTKDNRSCLCAASVLMAGYATEDQELVDFALHGHAGTKFLPPKTEGAGSKNLENLVPPGDQTPGGMMTVHFGEECLLPDGLWVEGCPAYTLGIAGCGLFDAAESLWHHGVDMYGFRNGALKRLLDSGVLLASPDEKMTVPALRDSGQFDLLTNAAWLNGAIGAVYQCGYRRYHEARYLPIIRNAAEHLELGTWSGPTFVKDNLPDTPAPPPVAQSVNFYSIGYGILRIADGERMNSLLLQFSEEKDWSGHDHPSRLGLDLYCWGEELVPFPGVIFPYGDSLNWTWYATTLANNTLVVDQTSELCAGTRARFVGAPRPFVPQVVYAPATTLALQRACCSASSVYPGTTLDRSLFLTSRYVADLFGGFCSVTRTYDLAWHLRGDVKADLALEPYKFPEPMAAGYNGLDNVKHAATDQSWSAAVKFQEKPLKFFAAAGPGTEVLLGDGHLYGHKDHPPTIIERRVGQKCTIFGNALDISGDNYLKAVTQEGSLEAGYGLLKLQTVKGTDLCFAAYRPGAYKAAGLETDAMQALVLMDGQKVQALYLGGGTSLKAAGATIARSEPGLAYVEKLANGKFVVGNPSPSDATVTVALPGAAEFKAKMKAMSTMAFSAQ